MVNFLSNQQYTFFRAWTFDSSVCGNNSNGANGADNANGANGVNGSNGANGTNGANGANGANGTNGNNGAYNTNGASNTNDVVAPAADDYKTQFNTKLGLIKKYCDDYIVLDENGNEIDIEKIKKEYANKPEEGVKYCDELINSFDQDKVEKIVKSQYKQRVDARVEAGKTTADSWVKAIDEAGTEAAKINTSNVNAKNVLDVIGGFVTNEDVKNGKVSLTQLFENTKTSEALISAIKAKAQSFIKRNDLDADVKETIIAQTNELVDAKHEYANSDTDKLGANRDNLVKKFMTLFATLRTEEAKANDTAAPQYYGLPEDSEITLTNESDRAAEEITAYNSRKTLNRNI